MSEISNMDDVIDSRDIIERLTELAEQYVASQNDGGEPLTDDEKHELDTLKALADEAEDYAEDWEYGETLIRDSYFKDYAQELAEDIGAIPDDVRWPMTCIDWDQAARELQQDYTAVDFDGVTYWVR